LSDFIRRRVFNIEETMTDSQTLLLDYVNSGSEAAFRELVARYLDLVYSTAVRLLGGDTAMAEDVAQTVFVDLARLAKGLSSDVKLGGWLHRHTCYVAAKTLRGERRRQSRERQAVEMNALTDHSEARLAEVAPILDEAINQLGASDRAARRLCHGKIPRRQRSQPKKDGLACISAICFGESGRAGPALLQRRDAAATLDCRANNPVS
jgi:RNA polymerase sigma factor (sigma-70 family)